MHLVVLSAYQGADSSSEQLQLIHQLLDGALSELPVVAWGAAMPFVWRLQRGAYEFSSIGPRYLRWTLG